MKLKIIILIFLSFILTGCNTSYLSLNNIGIVSSMIIDKKDDKYITYIEIYKEQKETNSNKITSYIIKGTGNNIQDAINNASNKTSKTLYFIHIKAIILTENIQDDNLLNTFNYLSSNVEQNTNYYILMCENAEDLIKQKDKENNIMGEKISDLIKYSNNKGSINSYDFLDKLDNYTNNNIDIYLNKVEIKNNYITINKAYYFNKNKIVGTLTNKEIELLNLFKNNSNINYTLKYKNKDYIIKIDNTKIKYKFNSDINITLNIKANIDYLNNNININDSKYINKLNNNTEKLLTKKLNNLINKLKNNKSDIIGINNYIYKIKGKQIKDFFKDNVNIKINVIINKKGLTHNTIGENNE